MLMKVTPGGRATDPAAALPHCPTKLEQFEDVKYAGVATPPSNVKLSLALVDWQSEADSDLFCQQTELPFLMRRVPFDGRFTPEGVAPISIYKTRLL